MRGIALVFALACGAQAAPMCRQLKPLAREMTLLHGPSNAYYENCGPGEFTPSNYAFATAADAPLELHIIGVHEGSFPPGREFAGPRGPNGAVRVFVYKTERPVLLVLSAYKPTVWDLSITQEATVERIILQGKGEQKLLGAPADIPVLRRSWENACGYAYAWEDRANHYGADYRLMIQSLRCATGLRETSFQGCYSGAVFEVPYYRKGPKPERTVDWTPPCPLDVEPELVLGVLPRGAPPPATPAPAERPAPPPAQPTPAPRDMQPVIGDAPPPRRPRRPAEDLPAPKGPASRGEIPARALAILMEGKTALATHDAIPDLIIALERGDTILKSRAADALGRFGPRAEPALDALLAALKDKSPRVRASAALALGNIGPAAAGAVRALTKALRSKYADERVSAETALERIGTEKALRALRKHRRRRGLD